MMGTDIDEQRRRLADMRKDFEVRYRFFSPEEGGRKTGPAHQFYRSDWLYDGDDVFRDGIYAIYPIFLDDAGNIVDPDIKVAVEGTAQMFILNDELRSTLHVKRIKPGVRGYFMEGPHRVAEAIVTKLLAISDDVPTGTHC
jgi:hypothetical protein